MGMMVEPVQWLPYCNGHDVLPPMAPFLREGVTKAELAKVSSLSHVKQALGLSMVAFDWCISACHAGPLHGCSRPVKAPSGAPLEALRAITFEAVSCLCAHQAVRSSDSSLESILTQCLSNGQTDSTPQGAITGNFAAGIQNSNEGCGNRRCELHWSHTKNVGDCLVGPS